MGDIEHGGEKQMNGERQRQRETERDRVEDENIEKGEVERAVVDRKIG
jgi:hypothetical protein